MKIKRLLQKAICVLCLSAMLCTFPLAYITNSYTLKEKITYFPFSGFTSTSKQHMSEAAEVWNNAIGSTLLSVSSFTQPYRDGFPKDDGNSYIYAQDVGEDYVAYNRIRYKNNAVTESDINLNMYFNWANSQQENCYDVYTVFLHELGHSVGLGDMKHSEWRCIMYYSVRVNTLRRELLEDDLEGVKALYG